MAKDRTWTLSGLASREEPFEIHFSRWARCRVYLCQVPLSRRIFSKNVSWIGLVSCFLVRFSLLRIFLVRFFLCSLTHRIPTEFWLLASHSLGYDTSSIQLTMIRIFCQTSGSLSVLKAKKASRIPMNSLNSYSRIKLFDQKKRVRPKPLIPSNRLGLSPGIP